MMKTPEQIAREVADTATVYDDPSEETGEYEPIIENKEQLADLIEEGIRADRYQRAGIATIWALAQYVDVDGSAFPGSYSHPSGERNEVAALRIKRQSNDEAILIEGRPEQILERAREILRTAELIAEQTMRDPGLRDLYGIAPSASGEPTYSTGEQS